MTDVAELIEELFSLKSFLAAHHCSTRAIDKAASTIEALSERIAVLAKLAGDVRWKELGEAGTAFTVIDRMMLRDLYTAGQASLTPDLSQ